MFCFLSATRVWCLDNMKIDPKVLGIEFFVNFSA